VAFVFEAREAALRKLLLHGRVQNPVGFVATAFPVRKGRDGGASL
jgi:hypothetical protein